MAYAVGAAFDEFRQAIELPGDYREIAASRRDQLVSLLKNDFEILEAFPSGSIPRFTAIKGYADLDVIVALHYGKHIEGKKPSQVLQAIQSCLSNYRTGVRRNGQAITLYYKTWPNVDIVPVSRCIDSAGNITHYNVPDMNTETWLVSNPKKHDQNMSDRNASFGVEFKRIVKMIKWWNKQHSDLMQSYHIEVLAWHICTGRFGDYPWDVYQFFDKAYNLTASPLQYEGGYADGYLDDKTRQEVRNRLLTARDKASQAWYLTYGSNNNHAGAIDLWRQIFGDMFPTYG